MKDISQLGQTVSAWSYQEEQKENQLHESMSHSMWGMYNKGGVVCLTSVEEEVAHMLSWS